MNNTVLYVFKTSRNTKVLGSKNIRVWDSESNLSSLVTYFGVGEVLREVKEVVALGLLPLFSCLVALNELVNS